jgi:hypothetical protein
MKDISNQLTGGLSKTPHSEFGGTIGTLHQHAYSSLIIFFSPDGIHSPCLPAMEEAPMMRPPRPCFTICIPAYL